MRTVLSHLLLWAAMSAVLLACGRDESGIPKAKIPQGEDYWGEMSCSQFYSRFAEEVGPGAPYALVDLELKGHAGICSIKMEAPDGVKIGGNVPWVVLNCVSNGSATELDQSGHFYIRIAPGNYNGGLEVTIADSSHKAVRAIIPKFSVKAGEKKEISIDYNPDSKLLFYEGFDNCVWGGNVSEGSAGLSFAPDSENPGTTGCLGRSGYETGLKEIECNVPGSAFMQSDTWSDCEDATVATSHKVSESYLRSRNLLDYKYLFRCQEYQGCLSIGPESVKKRGILQTPKLPVEEISDITVSFDFCFQPGNADALLFRMVNAGIITGCTVDGTPLASSEIGYVEKYASATLDHSLVSIPAAMTDAKTWHHAVVSVSCATDGSALYFAGATTSSSVAHGFFLDNIKVEEVKQMPRGSFRLLYWNIQNGMWSDQKDGYANFLAFVRKYDPDVCVWCEAQSIYKTGSTSKMPVSSRYFPDAWPAFARSYGHEYTAIGGYRLYADDYYPQVVTSKYPINTLLKITETDPSLIPLPEGFDHTKTGQDYMPVAHGAALQEINIGGSSICFVTLHLWPHAYSYYAKYVSKATSASSTAGEGNIQREAEIRYICSHTRLAPEYSSKQNWLMMGDFNTRSRLDNWYYKLDASDARLSTHNYILDNTDYQDIIGLRYPGYFFSTRVWASDGEAPRFDFVYASPAMYSKVRNALVLNDSWMDAEYSGLSNYYNPSDHRPILVDFDL